MFNILSMGGFSLSRVIATTQPVQHVEINIKEYSKGTHLLIQRTPFSNYCRDIVFHDISKDGLRFSASSLIALQQAGENMLLNTVREAVSMVEYNKRVTLCGDDLLFISKTTIEHKKNSKMAKLPKTNMINLCKTAGAHRVSADCYDTMVEILHKFLLLVLENVYSLIMSRPKKSTKCLTAPTVKDIDVSRALESLDEKIFGLASVHRR